MDVESKIWAYSSTGSQVHAFQDGHALCSKAVTAPLSISRNQGLDWAEAQDGHRVHSRCAEKFNALVADTETTGTTTETEEIDMADETRDHEGPLTPTQMTVLKALGDGQTRQEIGDRISRRTREGKIIARSEAHVSGVIRAATHKMGCTRSVNAVALYATAEAYLAAAELVEADVSQLRQNGGEVDEHVAYVLGELADILRQRAKALLPQ